MRWLSHPGDVVNRTWGSLRSQRLQKRPTLLTASTTTTTLSDKVDVTFYEGDGYLPTDVHETSEGRQERWFVGSIDQGTTSTRFIIFDSQGNPVASHQMGFENKHIHSG